MPLRPMSIGRILDRSFQIYRNHFVKLTLLMLLLIGPFYLLQSLLLFDQNAAATNSLIDGLRNSFSFDSFLNSTVDLNNTSSKNIWAILVFSLVLLPIYVLALLPLACASTLFLVRGVLFGEETAALGALLRKAFRRFWPMVLSTLLMLLILVGIYLVFVIVILIFVAIFAVGSGLTGGTWNGIAPGVGSGVFFGVFMVLLIAGFLLGWAYFLIRWGYYLPAVAMNEPAPAIGKSWKLTKRSFWRLFLMYVVLIIVVYVFLLVLNLIIIALAGNGLFSQLLQSLISVLISPLWILPYAVSFFDLKVRNEGMGLEDLLQHTLAEDGKLEDAWGQEPDKKDE
jgi:hypothetical protein